MILAIPLILAVPALFVPSPAAADPNTPPSLDLAISGILETLSPTVVQVLSYRPLGPFLPAAEGMARYSLEPSRGTYWATGVVVDDDGLVLTCAEAVQPGDSLEVRLADGSRAGATFLAQDVRLGVSLLRLDRSHRVPPVARAPLSASQRGEWLLVLNFTPDGDRPQVRLATLKGVATDQSGYLTYLHFNLPDCKGSCGGVVVDGDGRFCGMVVDVRTECETERMSGTKVVDPLECTEVRALSSDRLGGVLAELRTRSVRPAGFLGVSAALGESPDQAASPATAGPTPLYVVQVLPGSPAEVAGIRPGDQILEIGGRSVEDVSQVTERITALPPGTNVDLKVLRNGAPLTLTARLVDRSALEWMEREHEMDLVRQKRLRQSVRQLEARLHQVEQRISRYR